MHPLSAAQVMDVWEKAWPLPPIERALALWSAADETVDDPAALPIGAREHALLSAHATTFGPALDALATCPACGETIEVSAWIPAMLDQREAGDTAKAGDTVIVTHRRVRIECRLPSSADIAALPADAGARETRDFLARRLVVSARRGTREVDPAELTSDALDAIEEALASADPRADMRFELRCDACAHAWDAQFDPAAFLWFELDALARRLAADVHVLASAYGWSETEILSLSPTRRRLYVEVASR